jgi:hypothetical protein
MAVSGLLAVVSVLLNVSKGPAKLIDAREVTGPDMKLNSSLSQFERLAERWN